MDEAAIIEEVKGENDVLSSDANALKKKVEAEEDKERDGKNIERMILFKIGN